MKATQMIGNIPTHTLKQDYIRIENSKQYKEKIRQINPLDEDEYLTYWREIKKRVVEGYWGQESKGYRFCPPSLYFYTNFGLIQDTDEAKNTIYIKPLIQDLEWELHYGLLEAEGFSGFYNDDEITSDGLVLMYDEDKRPTTKRELQLFNSKGELKTYMTPRENIRRLHEFPKGPALFFNESKNFSILGSRSGGKSYTIGLAKALHAIITDGALWYNDGKSYLFPDYSEEITEEEETIVEVVLGSGDTEKSSELFSKIVAAMNALATRKDFGVWGNVDEEDYMPCPLYKDMAGSSAPGNKKNPWRHEYKVIKKGRELKQGTGSKITHVTYSSQKGKGKGAQAAAGGRVKYAITEESGLTELVIEAFNSNVNIVSRNGRQFGVQIFLGTSGNIESVQATKKMFLNPQDYNIVEYDDVWEGMGKQGKIGFFLPAYMVYRQFKDEDGNTDYQKAFKKVYDMRAKAASSSDPSVLRIEKMNRPIVPSEMWITQKGHYLPHFEAVQREKELIHNNKYLELAQPVTLTWNSSYQNGIKYDINHDAEPFYMYPLESTMKDFDSSIVIYDMPKFNVPVDYYFTTHDPYISDNIDKGGSFGATHVFINPRYWEEYMPQTGPIVATYIAKPTKGLKYYYQEQEKLIAFYGSTPQGLAYERNRGSNVKNYYMNKGKAHVLALKPQVFDKSNVFSQRVTEYGYNTIDVVQDLDRLNDLLLRDLPVIGKKFIETIPCLFTIKQIIQYALKDNLDAVDSIAQAPKHIGVLETERNNLYKEKSTKNEYAFFSTNKFLLDEN